MKKVKKIFLVILILMISLSGIVLATDEAVPAKEEITQVIESTNPDPASNVKVIGLANVIIGAIQLIGSIASILILIIVGIKYMMGSVDERAEYKEKIFAYIIGATMLFGITNILAVINSIMQ